VRFGQHGGAPTGELAVGNGTTSDTAEHGAEHGRDENHQPSGTDQRRHECGENQATNRPERHSSHLMFAHADTGHAAHRRPHRERFDDSIPDSRVDDIGPEHREGLGHGLPGRRRVVGAARRPTQRAPRSGFDDVGQPGTPTTGEVLQHALLFLPGKVPLPLRHSGQRMRSSHPCCLSIDSPAGGGRPASTTLAATRR
jgi:hypothetical protein